MSKAKKKNSDNEIKDLVKDFESKKSEIKKEQKKSNPDDRLTGFELQAMISTITGFKDEAGNLKTGVGNTPAGSMFNTKLIKNLIEAEENLDVIRALVPKLSEEEQKQYKEFADKRLEIAKENAGIPETEKVEEVRLTMIETAGNMEIYEAEVSELEKEYKDVIEKKRNAEDRWRELMDLPLAKCSFDMIRRSEIPNNLKASEIGPLWPMISKESGES